MHHEQDSAPAGPLAGDRDGRSLRPGGGTGPVINRPKSTGPRAGKKAVPLWLPAAAKRQLDLLVMEQDTTKQALLSEAVNDLFKKYRKPPIA